MHHFGDITLLLCHTFKGTMDMDCFTFKIDDKVHVYCAVTLHLCEKITIYIDIPRFITTLPTHRKTVIRKIRKFKTQHLITARFLHKNKNEKVSTKVNF